ncbi:phosphocholine-specific phospholipase C [Parapedobacter koreensis]|uniref:phospholipase C n=1 Tax=Parapedobacter koreensis TaxID=332977 RepID=A0A1H7FKH3_9SPHI|nr:phospholipase C, phosphocholine-specific [Parapedobacter koreensis]SEK26603.1 phospholipase C [Parapedobacter koreensis]
MDNSRRDFIKKAALLSGSAALANVMPPVIQKALAIHPAAGSTFYDAEHIVFLMQENRSFDHLFGTLQGVRGFNDPRAIQLPDKNRVWLQSNAIGETHVPFRLNTKETKVPWMGSTPHGWADQTDARNKGKYDRWLDVKKSHNKAYADVPLTMGYCDRDDFPFYYALADAFTVCDQNFCSSITGTHPNRYYWFTGTIRERNDPSGRAYVWNNSNWNQPELDWKTYPERLEAEGISWKIYQNELTFGYGLGGEERAWLSNFGTNPLEWFKAYNVRLNESTIANLDIKETNIRQEIARLEKEERTEANQQKLAAANKVLALIRADRKKYTAQAFESLPEFAKQINRKAFTINKDDPDYQQLTTLQYNDHGTPREINIPKGDVLHAFRNDVKNGTLPLVSWLAPPANFSDHPGAPWFGSWYVNEVMEILTENPEVWKKTIFILTYDENDGFFDHIPPYAVPNPYQPGTGKVSPAIRPELDFVTKDQQVNPSAMENRIRESAIGLGFRVPMIIASPWSRGGFVNSQVFDHTSSLQFLEHFIAKKFNKQVREENITAWRRAVCGDLTSVFRPYHGETFAKLDAIEKDAFIMDVHKALFKDIPRNYKPLTPDEIDQVNANPSQSPYFPRQEKGVRPACPLPYELHVNGRYDTESETYAIRFEAGNRVFGDESAGSPFLVYAINPFENEAMRTWEYAVVAGDAVVDNWALQAFENGAYHLRVYAPNGFYREFSGDKHHPAIEVSCAYERERQQRGKLTGNVVIIVQNNGTEQKTVEINDNAYHGALLQRVLAPGAREEILLDLSMSQGWYDFTVHTEKVGFFERFAGHVETGQVSQTDPLMGGVV